MVSAISRAAVSPCTRDGADVDAGRGEASLDGSDDVADGCSGGAGDDGDALGEPGDRLLAFGVEKPLFLELVVELSEGEFEGTDAARFESSCVELVFACPLEDGDGSGGDHFEAVGGLEFESGCFAAPHDAGEFAAVVFEGEVEVSAGVAFEVAEFADDVEGRGEVLLEGGGDSGSGGRRR